ncbi:MAG TPA: TatD family hydrolase [Candidatus Paceibacterota bacterium]|nr:TatD family hydrolase [Candidatus Paceibacterota bacterium]HMO82787.1 TatD family hydrolase [Candidatus Paceibacterota bacterium]
MNYQYIDTHAHLNLAAFNDDGNEVIAKCLDEKVAVINVGTKQSTSAKAVKLATLHDHLYAIVGLHPIQTVPGSHDEKEIGPGGQVFTSKGEVFDKDFYRSLATSSKKVVGIGECGFDYYHTTNDSYETQEAAFIAQIELANELNLPLMIHTRDPKPGETSPTGNSAYTDVHRILKQYAKVPGNIHFYAGNYEQAKKFFDLGFTISFTGVITFAAVYEDIVKAVPLDLMHAETDSPFVSPVPYRGQRCEPRYVSKVVEKIAEIKSLPLYEVSEQLLKNAEKLYKLILR